MPKKKLSEREGFNVFYRQNWLETDSNHKEDVYLGFEAGRRDAIREMSRVFKIVADFLECYTQESLEEWEMVGESGSPMDTSALGSAAEDGLRAIREMRGRRG